MTFQEVPAWTFADRSIIAGGRYEVFKQEGGEYGIVLPIAMAEGTVFVDSGRDWAIVLTGPLLICNLH